MFPTKDIFILNIDKINHYGLWYISSGIQRTSINPAKYCKKFMELLNQQFRTKLF